MAKFETPELLKEMIDKRFINVQKHPRFPLYLYNYSKRAQQKDAWNPATCVCRGMIMDKELNIVSRPFSKFFNHWEINPADIPNEPFTVTEKIDGSLGISYYYKGVWRIATRGSFAGRHAERANRILRRKYASCVKKMKPEYTYLFEVIYPENRIIVDYGNREELILLAVIDTETGKELTDIEDIGFPKLKTIEGFNSLDDVLKLDDNNSEGVVVRFENGCRLKVKFSEYKRLHSIMLSLTETKVWHYVSKGYDLEKLHEFAGEEYRAWINATAEKLQSAYNTAKEEIMEEFKAIPRFKKQKQAIEYIEGKEHAEILLNLLTRKPIEKLLWKQVKPEENASWFAIRG